jgi:cysteine-rich repeat protein
MRWAFFTTWVALLATTPAGAVSYRWAAPVSGSWSEPSRWEPEGVPGAGDQVAIEAATGSGAPYFVQVYGTVRIGQIEVDSAEARLVVSGGCSTPGGEPVCQSAALTVDISVVVQTGQLWLQSDTPPFGATLQVLTGALDIGVGATLAARIGAGGPRSVSAPLLINRGTLLVEQATNVLGNMAGGGSTFENRGSVTGSAAFDFVGTNITITNYGAWSVTNAGTRIGPTNIFVQPPPPDGDAANLGGVGPLADGGEVRIFGGTVTAQLRAENNGLLHLGGAPSGLAGSTVRVMSGGRLRFEPDYEGGGEFLLAGIGPRLEGGLVPSGVTVTVAGGLEQLGPVYTATTALFTAATVVEGTLRLASAADVGSHLTMVGGTTLTIAPGLIPNPPATRFEIVPAGGGPRTVEGIVIVEPGALLTVAQPTTLNGTVTNQGQVTMTAGMTLQGANVGSTNEGVWTINGANLVVDASHEFVQGSGSTLQGSAPARVTANGGTVRVDGGDAQLLLVAEAGGLLQLDGPPLGVNGRIQGTGRLQFQPGFSGTATVDFRGSSPTLEGGVVPTGAILRIGGDASGSTVARFTAPTAVAGQVVLASDNADTAAELECPAGGLTILASGVVKTQPGLLGGARVVRCAIANEGTFEVHHLTQLRGDITNDGDVLGDAELRLDGTNTTAVNRDTWNVTGPGTTVRASNTFQQSTGTLAGTGPTAAGGTIRLIGGTVASIPFVRDDGLLDVVGGTLLPTVNPQVLTGGRLRFDVSYAGTGTFRLGGTAPRLEGGRVPAGAVVWVNGGLDGDTTAVFATATDVFGRILLQSQTSAAVSNLNLASGVLRIAEGGILESFVGSGGSRIVSAPVDNAGTVRVRDGGDLRFQAGVQNLAAGTIAGNGTVTFAGTFNNAGIVAPGIVAPGIATPGLLTVAGATSVPRLDVKIGGLAPGSQHDRLVVDGVASLSGELRISLVPGFVPATDQIFTVLQAGGGVQGTFTSVIGELAGGTTNFDVQYVGNEVRLRARHTQAFDLLVSPEPLIGVPFSVEVRARDATGNFDPSYAGTVRLTSSDAQATIVPATLSAQNGLAIWTGVVLRTAGPQTVEARDDAEPDRLAIASFDLASGALSPTVSLVSTADTTLEANGVATTIVTVTPRDDFGNRRGAGATVTLETTAGTLVGTVRDVGDGTYTQILRAPAATASGTAVVSARVGGTLLQTTASILLTADGTPPGPVVATLDAATGQSVKLSWTAATAPDLDVYLVSLEDNLGQLIRTFNAATALTLDLSGLPECAPVRLSVRARDRAGNLSLPSNVIPVQTQRDGVPAAPSGLVARGRDGYVHLTIDKSPSCDVVAHRILRSTIKGGTGAAVAELAGATTTFVDTTVTNGASYFYVVLGVDGEGNAGLRSSEVEANPTDLPPALALTDFLVVPLRDGEVAGTWSPPVEAVDFVTYRVYRQATPLTELSATALLEETPGETLADRPPTDGDWYYAVTWVDVGGNESVPAFALVRADSRGPVGTLAFATAGPLGIGNHDLTLTLDEPPAAVPELTYDEPQGDPLDVFLTVDPTDSRIFTGTIAVAEDVPEGIATFSFRAADAFGHTSTTLLGGDIGVDGRRPTATLTTQPGSPVVASSVAVTLTTSEVLPQAPLLTFVSATGRRAPLSLVAAGPRTYIATLGIDADTGDGTGAFVVELVDAAGNRTDALDAGAALAVDFNPGPATRLAVTAGAIAVQVDDPVAITVVARDVLDRVDTSYRGTVRFTATDPTATLLDPATFTAADAGIRAFADAVVFRRPGDWAVHVDDRDVPTLQATLSFTVTSACGDGRKTTDEQCDDGGIAGGDGCSSTCRLEEGFRCTGSAPTVCAAICGDGLIVGAEACDDDDGDDGDGCSATCTVELGFACAGAPSVCTAGCGDGAVAGAEACDDGDNTGGDGCTAACVVEHGFACAGSPSVCMSTCGDGLVASDEGCDDGAVAAADGCSAGCVVETGFVCAGTAPSLCVADCGDGLVVGTEECDDGQTDGGDGCSATCGVESGYDCSGAPTVCVARCGDGQLVGFEACDDGNIDDDDGCSGSCATEPGFFCTSVPSLCFSTCGDGIVAADEDCDDGAVADGDGCSASCTIDPGFVCGGAPSVCAGTCGDGFVVADEACDDGNAEAGDGCSVFCVPEYGYVCDGEPSRCAAVCGDGRIAAGERCDDGNRQDGDGCSTACTFEPGFFCNGVPTVCAPQCGDGILVADEECDDGNRREGDGCAGLCTIEPGFSCDGAPSRCRTSACGDGIVDCSAGERCDDGNNLFADGCTPTCEREQATTVRWVGGAADACGDWASGAAPQQGDTIIVAASATGVLRLPAVVLESLRVEPGFTGTIELGSLNDGLAFVRHADIGGGTLAAPPAGQTVVGDVVLRAGAHLVLTPSPEAALSGPGIAIPAFIVRGLLTLEPGATLDGATGFIGLIPGIADFPVTGVASVDPITVGDLGISQQVPLNPDPASDTTVIIDAPIDVARSLIVRARLADFVMDVVGGPNGAVRARDVHARDAGGGPGAVNIDGLPVAFHGALALDTPHVTWTAPLEFVGARGSARIRSDGATLSAAAGLLTLDAAAPLAALRVHEHSVVASGALAADAITVTDHAQLLVRDALDAGTLAIVGGRVVAPPQLTVRQALSVAVGGDFVAGQGRVLLGDPARAAAAAAVRTNSVAVVTIGGAVSFFDLTLAGEAVEFAEGTAVTIAGRWTARGTENAPLSLRSSVPGQRWTVQPRGSVDLDHLIIRDSHNVGAIVLDPPHWTDAGGNRGWGVFDPCDGLVAVDGDVVLADDAAALALQDAGIQCIRGDLVVTGAVTTVSLPGLRRIVGALRIEATVELVALLLPALAAAQAIVIADNGALQTVDLSALATADDITIEGNGSLASVDLAALVDVDGSLTVTDNDALTELELSTLHNVGGDLTVTDNDGLTTLELGGLATVGGDLTLAENDTLASAELGVSTVGGAFTVAGNEALVDLAVAFLRAIFGDLFVADNDVLRALVLAALEQVGGAAAIAGGSDVETFVVQLTSLQSVGGGELEVTAGGGGELQIDASSLDTETTSVELEGELTGGSLLPPGSCIDGCAVCGDGLRGGSEGCDDGNGVDGDGCNAGCIVEVGFSCATGVAGAADTCVRDGDGDGVTDTRDLCPVSADPAQDDADGDRRGDACDDDDDDDGVRDALDNCRTVANAEQRDRDEDGVGDACDDPAVPPACGGTAVESDLDRDGIGDGCDDDVDGDGVPDAIDGCVERADSAQGDADGDGLGDACDDDDDGDGVVDGDDACPLLAGVVGCTGDLDGDGVADDQDSCATVANPTQDDVDGDGQGDGCDADLDGDGARNGVDGCPTTTDVDQTDRDGDGSGDACDACPDEAGDLPGEPCPRERITSDPPTPPDPAACGSMTTSASLPPVLGLLGILGALRARAGRRRAGRPAVARSGAAGPVAAVTFVVGLMVAATAVRAETRWAPVLGTAFTDPANWTGGAVPGETDDVVIGAGTPPCSLAGEHRVRSARVEGTVGAPVTEAGDDGARLRTTTSLVVADGGRIVDGATAVLDGGAVVVEAGGRVDRVVVAGNDVAMTLVGATAAVDVIAGAVVVVVDGRGAGAVDVDEGAIVVVDGPCTPRSWTQRGGQSLWRATAGAADFTVGTLDVQAGVVAIEGALQVTGERLRVGAAGTLLLDGGGLALASTAVTVELAAPLSLSSLQVTQPGADIGIVVGSALSVVGDVTAFGTPEAPIVLHAVVPAVCAATRCPARWALRVGGSLALQHTVLRDAYNSGALRPLPAGATDGGNNVGWQEPPPECGTRPSAVGPVVLADDGAVVAFDASGVACIAGDLVVRDAVTTVTLRSLEVVTGRILVQRSRATAVTLDGLVQAGDVLAQSNDQLQTVELGSLQDVGGSLVVTDNDALTTLELGGLGAVGGDLVFTDNDGFTALAVPGAVVSGDVQVGDNEALTQVTIDGGGSVGGDVALAGNAALTVVELGLQGTGGSLAVDQNPSLTSLELGSLTEVGGSLSVTGNDELRTMEAGSLASVGGTLEVGGNPALTQAGLGALVQVLGTLSVVDNPALAQLVLATLSLVGADFQFSGNTATVTLDVAALASVGGDFIVTENDALTALEAGELETVGGSLQVEGNGELASVDLSSLETVGGGLDIGDNRDSSAVDLGALSETGGDVHVEGEVTLPPGQSCDDNGTCGPTCGDGVVAGDEVCDDGNVVPGDGCSTTCLPERGWLCATAGASCLPDGDDDGIVDTADRCPRIADHDQQDTDGDGVGDACDGDDDDDGVADAADRCPRHADALQGDADDDGVGDACDADFTGPLPADPFDGDGDGVTDGIDGCPAVADVGQGDADGDDRGDACDDDDDGDGVLDGDDTCRLVVGAACAGDRDGDGLLDDDDPCPLVTDDGVDTDDDGVGDRCDSDIDGDRLIDGIDNCRFTFNPSQADRDDDGVGDACDRCFDVDDTIADDACLLPETGCRSGGMPAPVAVLSLLVWWRRRRRIA